MNRSKLYVPAIYPTTLLLLFFTKFAIGQNPFITTWKTDNPGTSNSTSISIATVGGGFDYDVDWENDGVWDDFNTTGDIMLDYGTAGVYAVAIRGNFPRI